ncbi:aminotransferase class IV [Clostridium chauvoei]|uniref:Aminotransferase class IV n=2 Tax=Clostridium chauvoei TaxID=46867 RepID=A0ABD4RIY9_9CLOT|nr:aminotransferase class IV [Clostridium chauvoei]ATD54603.1 aminotransferase class IV [Clostridium chauvoei]ATD57716.1 aminotransferase class IV [Clostridium chauvoei]MBX7281014.1 aminotransferase class IV [Clostridium chauvoei]MBX7283485.1 aminotransferase class IV [Clostridium chauvoei]MBX7286103.1 aminotransferase class IV [Clostridium chauvoei]
MEAINEFYLEDGNLQSIENYTEDTKEKERIIYEVLRVIDGTPLFLEEHIDRMKNTFDHMQKSFMYTYEKIEEFTTSLIKANKIKEGNIKITFDIKTDTMKVYSIKHSYPTKEMYSNGVETILYYGERVNPNAKVVDSDFRKKVSEEIESSKVFEAILVDNQGYITEGSKSNIFMIKDNTLITSKTEKVLPGVTRQKILEIARKNNINIQEKNVLDKELNKFQAMFISGTSPKILPISKIGGIDMDINNEIISILKIKFDELIKEYIENKKI